MKKTITTMSALLLLSATLAACNTETTDPATTTAANETPQEQPEATTPANTNTEPKTEPAQETKEPAQTLTPAPAPTTPTEKADTLTYNSLGKTVSDTVTTSTSEEMNYTISHFDNYTLQAEEPGIDQLIANNDDQLSMQIEVVTKEEVTFDQLNATAAETMAIISEDVKPIDFTSILEERTDILNLAGYETVFEETDKVVKVVFERDNLFVTLTIYDTVAADLQDAFLQMGLTIQ